MNMLECKKVLTLQYCLYYTSDCKQQRLQKLYKAVDIFILTFPANFHITKSRLSLNNTEILCWERVNLSTLIFLAIVCKSYD